MPNKSNIVLNTSPIDGANLTLEELNDLADNIRSILLKDRGATPSEYIKRASTIASSELGHVMVKAICNEPKLESFFPTNVFEILKNRFANLKSLPLNDRDKEFLCKNRAMGHKWLAKRMYIGCDALGKRAKRLGITLMQEAHKDDHNILDFIRKNAHMGAKWLGKKLHLSDTTARKKARKANIQLGQLGNIIKSVTFTPEEDAILKANCHKGSKWIAEQIGRTQDSVTGRAARLKIHLTKIVNGINHKKRIGILGVAFNPVTFGHIELACFIHKHANLDEVWFMPCYDHRLKNNLISAEHRLVMCKIACENFSFIKVFPYEIDHKLDGSVFSLFELLSKDPSMANYDFSFIIGSDNLLVFDQWKNSELLKNMVNFIVVPRQGIVIPDDISWYKDSPHLYLQPTSKILKVSSTEIRILLKDLWQNKIIKDVFRTKLNGIVLDYIIAHNLYREQLNGPTK